MQIACRPRAILRRIRDAVVVCSLLSLCGCGGAARDSSVLRIGLGGAPSTLDPQRAADTYSLELLRDLYEGLTSESPSGQIVPGAAESWSVSDDGLTYTFQLRTTARWSNGEALTSDDFVFALRRAVDPRTAAPAADLLSLITNAPEIVAGKVSPTALGVQALGDHALTISLRRPAPYFSSVLANAIAYPVHRQSLQNFGEAFTKPGRLISNGAYRLISEVPASNIRFERNPYYWDAATVAIRAVEFLPIADVQSEFRQYRAGALDITATIPTSDLDWAKTNLAGELQVQPQLATIFIAFNAADGSLHERPRIAEALSLAVDRQALTMKVLRAGQVAAYSFVPIGIAGYTPQSYTWADEPHADQLAQARELYRAAGYSVAKPLRIRFLYSQNEAIRNVAIATAAQWKEALGVETELIDMEFRAFLAARHDRTRWDVIIDGWNADYADPGNFLELFKSGGVQNDAGLADAEYDRLLDAAANEASPEKRLTLLAEAEKRLLADGAIAPLYFPVTRRLVKPYVDGAILNPMNHNYSKYLRLLSRPIPQS